MTHSTDVVRLGLVGLGKIARDQHVPSIGRTGGFLLQATASRNARLDGAAAYTDLDELLRAEPDIRAVALCTPPQVRFTMARTAIAAGKHVLLEKPPGVTVSEVQELERQALAAGVSLYTTWHSRHAAAVASARRWLAARTVTGGKITWREDVTHWHPGQEWIWEPGGMGVFDPGINALSILTEVLPCPVRIVRARFEVPGNRSQPIAAQLRLESTGGAVIDADLDWRQKGEQIWTIHIETDAGNCTLSDGGARLAIEGEAGAFVENDDATEYDRIYRRFAELIEDGRSDVDLAPFVHVADAFLLADIVPVEDFGG